MEDILILSEDGKTLLGVKNKDVSEVVIPDGVEIIENNAFLFCVSLSRVYIPDSVRIIGNAFGGCSSLKIIDVALQNSNYTSINGILFSKDLSYLVKIPEGINLVEYSIPDTVKDIGKAAFESCSLLKNVYIPNSVNCIGEFAFDCCSSLECIDIPDSVTSIGGHAFYS